MRVVEDVNDVEKRNMEDDFKNDEEVKPENVLVTTEELSKPEPS